MSEPKQFNRRQLGALMAAAGVMGPASASAQFNLDLGKIGDIGRMLKGLKIHEEDEIAIGEEMFGQFIGNSGGTYLNKAVRTAVRLIARPIFEMSNRKNFAWDVAVIDNNEVNAWALPGGKIGINKGLLRYIDSEDELAAVIAHEAGHVEFSHAAEEMKKKAFYSALSSAAQTAAVAALDENRVKTSAIAAGLDIPLYQLVTAGYSRESEREADMHIVSLFKAMDRDVGAAVSFFETLLELAPRKAKTTTSLFSGHPKTINRIAELKEAAPVQEGFVSLHTETSPAFNEIKQALPTRRYYMRVKE